MEDRIGRWLERLRHFAVVRVETAGEVITELPAAEGLAAEISSVLDDLAACRGSGFSAALRALDGEGRPVAVLRLRVPAPRVAEQQAPAVEQLLRVLTQHTQELVRLVVQSQTQILQGYREVISVARARAEEAEARAAEAEAALGRALEDQPSMGP